MTPPPTHESGPVHAFPEGGRPRALYRHRLIFVIWALVTTLGFAGLADYSNRAAEAGDVPADWPEGSSLPRDPERPTLVVALHPHCPCSRATVGELARLAPHLEGRALIHVLFLRPEGETDEWARTDLWTGVERVPGARARVDRGGEEIGRFGLETSGETLLYDAAGHLEFRGGLTAARGHAGDSVGRRAILDRIRTGASEVTESHVFGCALLDPDPVEREAPP